MKTPLIIVATLCGLIGPAAALEHSEHPGGWPTGKTGRTAPPPPPSMKPAKNIEKMPASSLSMKVGEKRSFKPVDSCGCTPTKILRCQIEKGILTVYAKMAGRAILMPINQKMSGPPQLVHATVTE